MSRVKGMVTITAGCPDCGGTLTVVDQADHAYDSYRDWEDRHRHEKPSAFVTIKPTLTVEQARLVERIPLDEVVRAATAADAVTEADDGSSVEFRDLAVPPHPFTAEQPARRACLLFLGPNEVCGRTPDDPIHQLAVTP